MMSCKSNTTSNLLFCNCPLFTKRFTSLLLNLLETFSEGAVFVSFDYIHEGGMERRQLLADSLVEVVALRSAAV